MLAEICSSILTLSSSFVAFVKSRGQGLHHLHTFHYHFIDPVISNWSCAGVWGHSTILSRFLSELLHRTKTESIATIRNRWVLRVQNQRNLSGNAMPAYICMNLYCGVWVHCITHSAIPLLEFRQQKLSRLVLASAYFVANLSRSAAVRLSQLIQSAGGTPRDAVQLNSTEKEDKNKT